jgi:hypothetical protein
VVRLVQGRVETPADNQPLSPFATTVAAAGTGYTM